MAVTINARGTSQNSFKLGKNGPLIKNNFGVIEFRDTNDTSFAEIRGSGGTPSGPNSFTTKSYVDSVASGLTVKDSVRVATATLTDMQDYIYQPSNDNTTSTPLIWERTGQGAVFDGITLADGDRVLIKESSDARGHGICTYVADTGGGDSGFRRADDADNTPQNELTGGTFVFVREGATQDSDGFVISSPNNVVALGSDDIIWSQFSGGSSSTGAGDGLTKTSNTLNVGGTTGRIVVTSDAVDLASVIQNFESTGIDDNASSTSITINSSQSVGIKDSSPAFSLSVGGTDGIKIPVGTTAQQPGTPESGLLRYNNTTSKLELYDGSFSNVATETFVSNNYQSLDSDLTALANTSSTGLYTVTGTGTSTTRSITGTGNEINVSNGNGVSASPQISLASNPVLPGVQGVEIPKGTTAQRPSSPSSGVIRWNTSTDSFESTDGSSWFPGAVLNRAQTFSANQTISARLFLSSGSASSPAIASDTDGNTGIFWSGADAIGFSTGGVERMTLSTTELNMQGIPVNDAPFDIVNTGTGSYTFTASDAGKLVTFDDNVNRTFTVPDSTFVVGTVLTVLQKGSGQIILSAGTNQTINNRQGHDRTAGQHSIASLIQVAANQWILSGDTA
jgi:hypothetical protein